MHDGNRMKRRQRFRISALLCGCLSLVPSGCGESAQRAIPASSAVQSRPPPNGGRIGASSPRKALELYLLGFEQRDPKIMCRYVHSPSIASCLALYANKLPTSPRVRVDAVSVRQHGARALGRVRYTILSQPNRPAVAGATTVRMERFDGLWQIVSHD